MIAANHNWIVDSSEAFKCDLATLLRVLFGITPNMTFVQVAARPPSRLRPRMAFLPSLSRSLSSRLSPLYISSFLQ